MRLSIFGLFFVTASVTAGSNDGIDNRSTQLSRGNEDDEFLDWRMSTRCEGGGYCLNAVQTYEAPHAPREEYYAPAAFAISQMLGDRWYIQVGHKLRPPPLKRLPSNQVMINCFDSLPPSSSSEKEEGVLDRMIDQYSSNSTLKDLLIPDTTCMSYRGRKDSCSRANICMNCYYFVCNPVEEYDRFVIDPKKTIHRITNPSSVKNDVKKNGPLACFFELKKPIPHRHGLFKTSLHSLFLNIVGFNSSHWIINPSLGTYFGEDGYYALRQDNVLRMNCTSAFANLEFFRPPSAFALVAVVVADDENNKQNPGVVMLKNKYTNLDHELPTHLDWRYSEDGKVAVLTPTRSHHTGPKYCGGCWTFASTSTVSDRIKLARGALKSVDMILSAQIILDCARTWHSKGCHGGASSDVNQWLLMEGAPDESCIPFTSDEQPCPIKSHRCLGKEYFVQEHGRVHGEIAMMKEIFTRGPIECVLATGHGFENYDGKSIICDTKNSTAVSHDVEIVGWGEEIIKTSNNGEYRVQKYWIARNSWGSSWGDNGFFKFCRGNNQNMIESNCAWALPTFGIPKSRPYTGKGDETTNSLMV